MRRAIAVEMLKLRRSPVVLVTTALILVLVPLLCLGFFTVAENGGAGALALKAQALVQGEGWEAYTGLLGQMIAVTLFIGPGVVVAWTFGREHADRTFPALFGLPVSRGAIATAKFAVLAGWGFVLTLSLLAVAAFGGALAHVGPVAGADLPARFGRLAIAGILTMTIALTVGFVASIGRGYLPAIGAIILLTMAAQVAVLFGTGAWFPYAAPGLYAVAGADGVADVSTIQLLLVPATALAVVTATVRWWDRAEAI